MRFQKFNLNVSILILRAFIPENSNETVANELKPWENVIVEMKNVEKLKNGKISYVENFHRAG